MSFEADWAKVRAKVEKVILDTSKLVVTATYDAVLANSRIYSGYYKANHRILVLTQRRPELNPAKRGDVQPLQFLDQIEATRVKELAKLGRLKKLKHVSSIRIATGVPYAPLLEAIDGTYSKAAAQGALAAKR